jgi:hypothetical protein
MTKQQLDILSEGDNIITDTLEIAEFINLFFISQLLN